MPMSPRAVNESAEGFRAVGGRVGDGLCAAFYLELGRGPKLRVLDEVQEANAGLVTEASTSRMIG